MKLTDDQVIELAREAARDIRKNGGRGGKAADTLEKYASRHQWDDLAHPVMLKAYEDRVNDAMRERAPAPSREARG